MSRKPRNLIEKKKRVMDQAIAELHDSLADVQKEQKKANKKIRKMMKDMEKPLKV
jgi:uncharacterized coiled-coil protein SlyX